MSKPQIFPAASKALPELLMRRIHSAMAFVEGAIETSWGIISYEAFQSLVI